jgi:para-aminobenzoate synthetase
VRTLVIDNYDSFVWNLAHAIALANGVEPLVVRNDVCSWQELWARGPFDNIVISPGPGTVERAADLGMARSAIELAPVPVLGVCLGHQGIAHVHGGTIRHTEPVHGLVTRVRHEGDELFKNIPSPWSVVRYHSLVVASPLPPALQAIAYSDDGLVMALRHRERWLWGVQFHPESILTEQGQTLLDNFRDITHARGTRTRIVVPSAIEPPVPEPARQVTTRSLATGLSAEDLFVGLYRDASHAFWLDSAAPGGGARFSILGAPDADAHESVRIHHRASGAPPAEFLARLEADLAHPTVGGESLPLAFRGGWIGYFGYEMAFADDLSSAYAAPIKDEPPAALWLRADRFLVIDHQERRVHLVAVSTASEVGAAESWLATMQARIEQLAPASEVVMAASASVPITLELEQSRADYLASIERCRQAIRDGESYEINLTNRLQLEGQLDGLSFYRVLRQVNPAPFAAYLKADTLEVLSASPERFLKVDATGRVEAKPIKGTSRRDADPTRDRELAEQLQRSEKNRAENLMIVDLLRNDLSRVSIVGSVRVPELMYVETYATVHHLLSTITAQLAPNASLIDLLRAAFPGGSVTGAPKIRTMQLIASLERSPRAVYCGSIGYLGYNRVADLNIAIRTLTYDGNHLCFGAGGAITHLSDPAEEFAEMLLKAEALIRPLCRYFSGSEHAAYRLVSDKEAPCTAG